MGSTLDKRGVVQHFWSQEYEGEDGSFSPQQKQQAQKLLKKITTSEIEPGKRRNKPNLIVRQYAAVLLGECSDDMLEQESSDQDRCNWLQKKLFELQVSKEHLASSILVINYLIDLGNTKRIWKNLFLPSLEKVFAEVNPLNSSKSWQKILVAEQLVAAFEADLKNNLNNRQNTFWRPRLYFSLMVDSFAVTQSLFQILAVDMFKQDCWHYLGRMAFLELPFDGLHPRKKYFIAPRTELVLAHLKPTPEIDSLERIHSLLNAYFIHLGFTPKSLPHNLRAWLKLIKYYLHMQLPPLLLAVNSSEFDSCSLNAHTSNQFFATRLQPVSVNVFIKTSQKLKHKGYGYRWQQVRKIFNHTARSNKLEQVHQNIRQLLHHTPPLLQENERLLLEWGQFLLPEPDQRTQTPAPASVLAKLDSIAKKIFACAANQSIIKLNADQRSLLYHEVLELAESSRNRISIRYTLKGFEQWLIEKKHLIKVSDYEELFSGVRSSKDSVNASLITFDHYQYAKQYLKQQQQKASLVQQRRLKIIYLFLVLGFRCGLRRREIAQLKKEDYIYCPRTPQIVIREGEGRKLKSSNAVRSFYLPNFLDQEELDELNDYYHQYHQKRSLFLFSLDSGFRKPLDANRIMSTLMGLLRKITSNPELTFHQLRHSFASWHFLSMVSAEFNLEFEHYFTGYPATQSWLSLAACKQRKQHHLGHELQSKKYPYWLQKHMGHSSIEMTLEHYIHFSDIALSALQCRPWLLASNQVLSEQTGVSIDTLKKHKGMKKIHAILKSIRKNNPFYYQYRNKKRPLWQPPKRIDTEMEHECEQEAFYQAYRILEAMEHNHKPEKLLFSNNWSQEEIAALSNTYKTCPACCIKKTNRVNHSELAQLIKKINKHYQQAFSSNALFESPQRYATTLLQTLASFYARMHVEARSSRYHYFQSKLVLIFGSNDVTDALNVIRFLDKLKLPFRLILRHSAQRTPKECRLFQQQWREQLSITKRVRFTSKKDHINTMGEKDRIELIVLNREGKYFASFYFLMAHTIAVLVAAEVL